MSIEPSKQPEKRKWRFGFFAAWGTIVFLCTCIFIVFLLAPSSEEGTQQTVVITDPPVTRPAATPPAQPTITPNVGGLGERREEAGIALTVIEAYLTPRFGAFSNAQDGYIYLVIEVLIENVGRDEAPYNPLYFSVKDADGFEYSTAFGAPDPSLKSGTAAMGELVRGFIAFEIREQSAGLIVVYEPLVILGGYDPIRIALGDELERH